MELINRYIHAVTHRLPEKKRRDIGEELRSIIEDMLEQHQGPEPQEEKVCKVLEELGNPDTLANNYRGAKQYLIGPGLYCTYLTVLKIVLGGVFIGVSIAGLVGSILTQGQNIAEAIGSYISTVFAGLMQAFAWITIGFAIAEYHGAKIPQVEGVKEWSIADLPDIPDKKAVIPRSESIAGIVFTTLFLILFWSALNLIGVGYFTEETGLVIVPVFNLNMVGTIRWLVSASFIIGIAKETLKLIFGRWSLKLALLVVGLSLISLLLAMVFLSNPDIWNPNFIAEYSSHVDFNFDLVKIWEPVTRNMVFVVALGFIIEIITVLYKGIRYST